MTDIARIEELTQTFADRRKRLVHLVEQIEAEVEAVKRRYLPSLRTFADDVAEARAQLHTEIQEHPELFAKPKSIVVSGVKVGYRKQKGKLLVPSEEATIRLIRKHLPDQADLLIDTVEKVLKTPLANLSGAELKKISVEVEADSDQVLIQPTDSDTVKLVDAYLAELDQLLQEVA